MRDTTPAERAQGRADMSRLQKMLGDILNTINALVPPDDSRVRQAVNTKETS